MHKKPVSRSRRARSGAAGARIRPELSELARNLWWSWDPEARRLWEAAAERFRTSRRRDLLRNPAALVRALGRREIASLASDAEYLRLHERVLGRFRSHLRSHPKPEGFRRDAPVAYFSMEFAVHESLPIYAGGLGVLAGDHLKSSSDEGIPTVGVGLFYHAGYFRQEIDARGRHRVVFARARTEELPMEIVRGPSGRELRIGVELPDRTLVLRAWKIAVGRVPLYLLDADVPENSPRDRSITWRLYGSDREERLQQELAIGIGGVRLLRALGIRPGVWHLNEGHVAFLALERLREERAERPGPTRKVLEAVASNIVFTTHTPVPAGNEEFDLELAARYLERPARAAGLEVEECLRLGRYPGLDGKPCLSMTVLAIHLSRFRNGVSELHGEVARRMWAPLFHPLWRPRLAETSPPIVSVTNGVHAASWISPEFHALFARYLGSEWTRHLEDPEWWTRIQRIPEPELWDSKSRLKTGLIRYVREREEARLRRLGVPARLAASRVETLLDPEALTIGFARRFVAYKRPALLFHDVRRAARLFGDPERPVQIVFAGKPHPDDREGHALFDAVTAFGRRAEFRGRVAVLENYDLEVGRHLVWGADVWLNNPRRPNEASGTSGQKVPLNGGLNLSIRDGWWDEAYSPSVGFAFGTTEEGLSPEEQDRRDARDLYRALERDVIPLYYRRDGRGVPVEWCRRVKDSMQALIPRFNTSRMVAEYARKLYRPALGRVSRKLR